MRVLILDNYDSFTWNIFHYVQQFTDEADVVRNDQIDLSLLDNYTHIILSPGPGLPSTAALMPEVIRRTVSSKKILGICLGMQAVAEHFGARLYNLREVAHGISAPCNILREDLLFKGISSTIDVGRYHSWAVDLESLPDTMECIAIDNQNVAMAIRHKDLPVRGIQFHPESVMTPDGLTIIRNWLYE